MMDDVQRLRTVTSLDVSAVAGHHAMPAALLFDENICTAQNFDECTIFNPSLLVSSISV